jgi:hypothetical protein
MLPEEKNKIADLYFQIGEIHGRVLSKQTLISLVNSLDDLIFQDLYKTMQDWLKNGTHFPLPAHIRQKINPTINERDDSIDAVNRIISAVSKFGRNNNDRAREWIGELGWETCKRFGGWEILCEVLNFDNEGTIRAQLRELAQVVLKKSIRGELETRPTLPKPILSLVETCVKKINPTGSN